MDVFCFSFFTPEAFSYWLPAFLEVAIIDPEEGWSAVESLLFRFQSLQSEQWQIERFKKLSNEQLKVVEDYFELEKERLLRRMDAKGLQVVDRDTVDPHMAAALDTLKKERNPENS